LIPRDAGLSEKSERRHDAPGRRWGGVVHRIPIVDRLVFLPPCPDDQQGLHRCRDAEQDRRQVDGQERPRDELRSFRGRPGRQPSRGRDVHMDLDRLSVPRGVRRPGVDRGRPGWDRQVRGPRHGPVRSDPRQVVCAQLHRLDPDVVGGVPGHRDVRVREDGRVRGERDRDLRRDRVRLRFAREYVHQDRDGPGQRFARSDDVDVERAGRPPAQDADRGPGTRDAGGRADGGHARGVRGGGQTYSVGETARRQDGDRGGAGLAGDEGEGSGIRREGEVGDGHRRGDFNGHGGGVDQVPARARERDHIGSGRRAPERTRGRLASREARSRTGNTWPIGRGCGRQVDDPREASRGLQ